MLNLAESLPDEVLLICRPLILSTSLRDRPDRFWAGIRLQVVARHTDRFPQLRELVPSELRQVAEEALQAGWGDPGDDQPSWAECSVIAKLTDDPTHLSLAVALFRDAQMPNFRLPDRKARQEWLAERADFAKAQVLNSATPRSELVEALAGADARALEAVLPHGDDAVRRVCREHLHRLEAAERNELSEVPVDEVLEASGDPAGELRKELRLLTVSPAQRELTCAGLLASKYVTADIVGRLPAYLVLQNSAQPNLVAEMIAEAGGDDAGRWSALAQLSDPPVKSMKFATWLEQVQSSSL